MKRPIWFLALLCAGLPLPSLAEGECSMRGCSDGLALQFVGLTSEEFKVSLSTEVGTLRISCPDGTITGDFHPRATSDSAQPPTSALCSPDGSIFLERFTQTNATVVVSVDGRAHKQPINPSYHNIDANGPNCEPHCRQALVTIKIPIG